MCFASNMKNSPLEHIDKCPLCNKNNKAIQQHQQQIIFPRFPHSMTVAHRNNPIRCGILRDPYLEI
jgi:hypothetical protein